MTLTINSDGSISGFVRLTDTKGAVFESGTIQSAIRKGVNIVAQHCTTTGEHPGNIIQKVEYK